MDSASGGPFLAIGRTVKRLRSDLGLLGQVMCGLTIAAASATALSPAGSEAARYLPDLMPIVVASIASAFAVVAATRTRSDRSMQRTWWWLAGALAVRASADATWAWIELVRHRDPFPSLADIGYLLFYPALLMAFASVPSGSRTRPELFRLVLDVASLVVAGVVAVWYFMLAPTLTAGTLDSLAKVLNVVYPVGDMLLVFAVGATLVRATKAMARRPLQWLMFATGSLLVGDLTFAQLSLNDNYQGSGAPDFWWTWGLGAFAVAAVVQIRQTEQVTTFTQRLRELHEVPRVSAAPYIGVGISCALLVGVAHGQAFYPTLGVSGGTIVVIALVVARQLAAMTDNRRLVVAYQRLANTDPLTGLATRGRLLEVTALGLNDCERVCVLLIDIDHFKSINDEQGHHVGDAALRHVAQLCRADTRDSDSIAGRYGGDELMITLFEVDVETAELVADRLRKSIESHPLHVADADIAITVSIGVAERSAVLVTTDSLIEAADLALYTAKRAGRNTIRSTSIRAIGREATSTSLTSTSQTPTEADTRQSRGREYS